MRDSKTSVWLKRNSSGAPVRALRLASVALGIGLVMATGVARAQDDEDNDERTFEEKIIDGLMSGLGGTNMDSHGIDYRERSPLVVPPKLDLPPPASTSAEVNVPNWPKDPDEARRKKAVAARKKDVAKLPWEAGRGLAPDELNVAKTAPGTSGGTRDSDSTNPGVSNATALSPSQLGYNGGLWGMFHGNTSEEAKFTGEPTRDSLTQPPVGYQTPSPNFAYGTGPKESNYKGFDPYNQNSH